MKIYPFGAPDAIDMIKCPYHDACVHYGCPELCSCYNSSIGKTRIKMQTFRIIAKNPSHENAASKLVSAAVRFFVLAKFVRSKQHSALLYETAVLLFSPLSARRCAMI